MFQITVNTRRAIVGEKELITTRSAGIQVQFTFSEDWDGLAKFAIFRNGEDDESRVAMAIPSSGLVELPAENCAVDYIDEPIFVGVYGNNGLGTTIIPTIWASMGVLREGASYEGAMPADPTPDMWAQILAIANEAHDIAEDCAEAEQLRAAAEELRVAAETARVAAENGRVSAEEARVTAENLRATAEDLRVTAENARSAAEQNRATAEAARASAEASRQQNESTRQSNETARQTAESNRASAESTRASNEQARRQAETARADAEGARADAETARVLAESARVAAEQARVNAENARGTAEDARASAEALRASAESARASAEAARATAESNRADTFADWATTFNGWQSTLDGKADQSDLDALSTDVTELNRQISDLDSAFNAVAAVTESPNLINPSLVQTGKFYHSADGVAALGDNSAFDCYLFPVEQGKTYTFSGVSFYMFGVTENMAIFNTPVNNSNGAAMPTVTITSASVKYLTLSWRRTTYPTDTYIGVEGSTLPEYTPFGEENVNFTEKSMEYIRENINVVTDYYVGYGNNNGVTRFANVIPALWAISNATGGKRLHIAGGTYDLYTELGGREYIISKNTTDNRPYDADVQPWISDTQIIGEGKVVLNFKLPNDIPYANYWLFSALNVRGNFEIENVEIYAENCRYAIHDESKSEYPNTIRKYSNCIVSHRRTDSTTNSQTIGSGFSDKTRCEYSNMILINNNGLVWSCHANAGTSLQFDNVVFRNELVSESNQANVVRVSNNGMWNVPVRAVFSNCYFGNGILILREENNDNHDSNTRVDLINTKIGSLNYAYTTNIYEPVTSYNTITGEITELITPNV